MQAGWVPSVEERKRINLYLTYGRLGFGLNFSLYGPKPFAAQTKTNWQICNTLAKPFLHYSFCGDPIKRTHLSLGNQNLKTLQIDFS